MFDRKRLIISLIGFAISTIAFAYCTVVARDMFLKVAFLFGTVVTAFTAGFIANWVEDEK